MAVDLTKYQDPGLPENKQLAYLRQLSAMRKAELDDKIAQKQQDMMKIEADLAPAPEQSSSAKMSSSVLDKYYPITQHYGNYNPALYKGITKDSRHLGVDVATPSGTSVYSPVGGRVSFGSDKNWGNYALVEGEDGVTYRFSHLNSIDDLIRQAANASMQVKAGQMLGLTGSTGNSTGPHLDISTMRNGQYFNPLSLATLERALAGR